MIATLTRFKPERAMLRTIHATPDIFAAAYRARGGGSVSRLGLHPPELHQAPSLSVWPTNHRRVFFCRRQDGARVGGAGAQVDETSIVFVRKGQEHAPRAGGAGDGIGGVRDPQLRPLRVADREQVWAC